MATLTLTGAGDISQRLDALVTGAFCTASGPVLASGSGQADRACGYRLAQMVAALGGTGAAEEISLVPAEAGSPIPLVAVVGLGHPARADGRVEPETLRRAAGTAVRALAGRHRVGLTLALANEGAAPQDVAAVGEGALLAAYEFTRYQRATAGRKMSVREVIVAVQDTDDPVVRQAIHRCAVLAAAVHLARDLVNTPASDLTPSQFAAVASDKARAAAVGVEIMDEAALLEGGYGGICAVGAGSANPPRLVTLSYQPPRPACRIALVGKGITFDSGGLTLKSREGLIGMKGDMAGAAAVLAATIAAAQLALPLSVTGYLPMAENMPGGSAYRPGDVLRMRNGLFVEIRNTDAEGRLILADAVARACEDRPDYLLCTATLTGAQRIALGHRTGGVMGDDHLVNRVKTAGSEAGEPMWPMPLPEDIPEQLTSDVADLANWCADPAGGMLRGAMFVSRFVSEGTPWAHMDISSLARNTGTARGYTPTGATGAAVRTLIRTLENLAATPSGCPLAPGAT